VGGRVKAADPGGVESGDGQLALIPAVGQREDVLMGKAYFEVKRGLRAGGVVEGPADQSNPVAASREAALSCNRFALAVSGEEQLLFQHCRGEPLAGEKFQGPGVDRCRQRPAFAFKPDADLLFEPVGVEIKEHGANEQSRAEQKSERDQESFHRGWMARCTFRLSAKRGTTGESLGASGEPNQA
jgi:hypothetical protein